MSFVVLSQLQVSHEDDNVTFSCYMKFGDVIDHCSVTLRVICE